MHEVVGLGNMSFSLKFFLPKCIHNPLFQSLLAKSAHIDCLLAESPAFLFIKQPHDTAVATIY